MREVAEEGEEGALKTWWVSLAPPKGKARVVIVDSLTMMSANAKVHRLGLYRQGDESYIVCIPPTEAEHALPRDRVLTEDELLSVNAASAGELSDDEYEKLVTPRVRS